ncbi:MAG: hypothetical protein Q7S68_05950, partial [Deltaproteobacteria bacterium]|nr:hypothetical protein [Deltaproteobacteria bacterium]
MFLKHAAFLLLSLRGRRPWQSKTKYWIASLALAMTLAVTAHSQITKIDPAIRLFNLDSGFRRNDSAKAGIQKAISYDRDGKVFVDSFVSVFSPADAESVAQKIRDNDGVVRSIIDEIMTANLPLDFVEELSQDTRVRYIEAGKPLSAKMNQARLVTNIDDVNAGTGLDARYDGSGVIVGIVDDTRPDFTHADFKDDAGDSRVLFYWDKSATGSGVSEISG